MPRTAIVADIRGGEGALPELESTLEELRDSGVNYQLLFLEAANDVLVRRYKENRRPHPLAARSGKSTIECIRAERELLEGLRGRADIIVDTSDFFGAHLRDYVVEKFGGEYSDDISIYVISFGFKYGIPIDADHGHRRAFSAESLLCAGIKVFDRFRKAGGAVCAGQ